MTESAIRWGLTRDLYVALGEPLEGTPFGAWSVRVQHKPFMRWVWGGAVLMALGALCAAASRRYRKARGVVGAGLPAMQRPDADHPLIAGKPAPTSVARTAEG